jgi:hypothetical protein
LLVRIRLRSQSFQRLTAILILHNFADEVYGSEPDGCARFSSGIHGSLRAALQNPIANVRRWRSWLLAIENSAPTAVCPRVGSVGQPAAESSRFASKVPDGDSHERRIVPPLSCSLANALPSFDSWATVPIDHLDVEA